MSRGEQLSRNNPRLCKYLLSYDFHWKEAKLAEKSLHDVQFQFSSSLFYMEESSDSDIRKLVSNFVP